MPIQFAFQGSGTFSGSKNFDTIKLLASSAVAKYDTTGALEILFDVAKFNSLIGIIKDVSNVNITSTNYYDSFNDVLLKDSLTLTSADFVTGLNNKPSNINSVGRLSTLYSDFAVYIASYFGLPPSAATASYTSLGFETLFSGEYMFNPNGGVFGAQQFLDVTTSGSAYTAGVPSQNGAYVENLNGSITLNNITKLLRYAVANNTFNNRNTYNGTTASAGQNNYLDKQNYGVSDGFYDGDILFIPDAGFQITLNLGIKSTTFKDTAVGVTYSNATGILGDAANSLPSSASVIAPTIPGTFSEKTTSTGSLINRVVKVPLLIRLTNLNLPYISSTIYVSITSVNGYNYRALTFKGLFEMVNISRFASYNDVPTIVVTNSASVTTTYDPLGNAIYTYIDTSLVILPNNGSNPNVDYYYTVTPHRMATQTAPYIEGTPSLVFTGAATAPPITPTTASTSNNAPAPATSSYPAP
jgi:hypothetical protein